MSKQQKKGHFLKNCRSEHRKQQEIEEITEPDENQQSDTDRSKNITTKIKHASDRRNQINLTVKIDGTEKEFIVNTQSRVKKTHRLEEY